MKKDNETEVKELANEELGNVNGGATFSPVLLRNRLAALRFSSAYHIKDSGPTWVNSPGSFVLPAVLPVLR